MKTAMMGALGAALVLAGCGDPVTDEDRAAGEAARAAIDACFQQAGFTTGQTSPAPVDGENRRGLGGNAWSDGSIQAADGTWLDIYHWNEWTNEPDHAENTATYQAQVFNEQGYEGYGEARAVGRRAYVPVQSAEPFPVSDALDACLMMP